MVWQNRCWELKFSDTRGTLEFLQTFAKLPHGVYQSFAANHFKDGKWHCHVAMILQKEKIKFRTQKNLTDYFGTTQCHPLKHGKGVLGKLNTFYNYCSSQEKHQG